MSDSYIQHRAAQFRVALLLKQYKFGAAAAAKFLGKPRGLVQSWMQIGSKHGLAKEKIKIKSFEKIIKKLRRRITKENLDYFLAVNLMDLDLPVAFISRILNLPMSTVRSWRDGKVPPEIKRFFYEQKLVDREFNKLLKKLKTETTRSNLPYFLSLEIATMSDAGTDQRRLGGRLISQILSAHFNFVEPIPDKTISCWIEGKRKPWDAFDVLVDKNVIKKELNSIINELTYSHLSYHMTKALSDRYGWSYNKISKVLGLNKERVRGWVKKDRGNPIAKLILNQEIIDRELEKYLGKDKNWKNYNIEGAFNHEIARKYQRTALDRTFPEITVLEAKPEGERRLKKLRSPVKLKKRQITRDDIRRSDKEIQIEVELQDDITNPETRKKVEELVETEEIEEVEESISEDLKEIEELVESSKHGESDEHKESIEHDSPAEQDGPNGLEGLEELEQELIYHLETIPTGVTSAKVLRSILINKKKSTLEDIEKVLDQSPEIIKNIKTGKWMLKRFLINVREYDEHIVDNDFDQNKTKEISDDKGMY